MSGTHRAIASTLSGALLLVGWVAACAGSADTRREDDVFISAVKAEIAMLLGDSPRSAAPTFCVAIDPGDAPQSPRKEVVARLKGSAPRVVRSAECEVRHAGVFEVPTGRAAVLLTVGPVEWLKTDEAEVDVITTHHTAESMRRRYRIAYEGADGFAWDRS